MAFEDLETIEYKLRKRGFRREDGYVHECTACREKAVLTYVLSRPAGRDISLCLACGVVTSWRSSGGLEGRTQDLDFDLRAFLG